MMRSPRPRSSSRRAGFTLIELMVALALGSIIAVIISWVSTEAREAYTQTVSKVEVYNNFRLAYNTLQKDLSGWIASMELEPYTDGKGGRPHDFHWQPGEETPDQRDENGPGVVDGGTKNDYDEFAFIEQVQYESIEPSQIQEGDNEKKVHDAYHLYFKTMTYIAGAVREANVEYMLVDAGAPPSLWVDGVPPPPSDVKPADVKNLALYKVVRYLDIDESTILALNRYPGKRAIIELATNVTDFRVEYLVYNPFDDRVEARYVTPGEEFLRPTELVTRPLKMPVRPPVSQDIYRKVFGYGSMKVQNKYPLGTAFVAHFGDNQGVRSGTDHRPLRFGFESSNQIQFAELVPGDTIYVFTPSSIQSAGAGGGGAGGVNFANLARMPAQEYTVKGNVSGMLEFVEDVDSSGWGEQNQSALYYKAPFLPSAVRLTLRMVNDDGLNPKTMQQVIWLRRKSR